MYEENVAKNVIGNIFAWILIIFVVVLSLGIITIGQFTNNGLKGKD